MWKVRPVYAVMMYLNVQDELLAAEAPHLEHHRTRLKSKEKQCTSCRNVKRAQTLCYSDVS